jgi:hypothetical protein
VLRALLIERADRERLVPRGVLGRRPVAPGAEPAASGQGSRDGRRRTA